MDNMQNIHISQIYPCSRVDLACELYYICELGKYAKLNYGKAVSLDGVLLSSVLEKSVLWDYFRMAVSEGWLCNTGVSQSKLEINIQQPLDFDNRSVVNYKYILDSVSFDYEDKKKREADYDYNLRTPVLAQVSFESMTDEAWVWSINGKNEEFFTVNNASLNHNRADQSWLSLIAFVAIERLFTGSPEKLGLRISSNLVLSTTALSYVMILDDMTNALSGWCFYSLDDTISDSTKLQLGYVAWYTIGRDKGLLDRWYSGKEKFEYLKTLDIAEGDLVMFYERDKAQKMNLIKSVNSCHLAKVVKLTDDVIDLELISTVKPYYEGMENFNNHSMAVKRMWLHSKPYESLCTSHVSYALADVGVEYMMYTEKYFIVPLNETDDYKRTVVSDGTRRDVLLLNQNNLIYWILKDYEYEFNEDKFLKKYFANSEPVYTRYMRGDQLEDFWYYKEVDQFIKISELFVLMFSSFVQLDP